MGLIAKLTIKYRNYSFVFWPYQRIDSLRVILIKMLNLIILERQMVQLMVLDITFYNEKRDKVCMI